MARGENRIGDGDGDGEAMNGMKRDMRTTSLGRVKVKNQVKFAVYRFRRIQVFQTVVQAEFDRKSDVDSRTSSSTRASHVKFTVKHAVCSRRRPITYGVFDSAFDFDSQEWGCSERGATLK